MNKSTGSPVHRVFNLVALQEALQIAQKHSATEVLEQFSKCLGKLLWVAVKTKNTSCIQKLIEAGADTDFAELSFHGQADWAFRAFAAEYYFRLGYPVPSQAKVLEEFSDGVDGCPVCSLSGPGIPIDELAFKHEYCTVWSPLVFAIQNKDLAAAKTLIKKGASLIKDCGVWKECYVHVNAVDIAILENTPDILSFCIKQGYPIKWAVEPRMLLQCKTECLQVLLKAGIHHQIVQLKHPLAIAAGFSGKQVPKEHQEPKPFSLKFIAREVIRDQLLENNDENLFTLATREHLPLPKSLCRYIVCDFEL